MTNPFKIFLIKKEERWLAAAILLVFVALQALFIASEYRWYTMGAPGGFWSIFTKHYRMSGYDCWSWITISGMRIHFETIRHPLYLTFLYPMHLVDKWLMETFDYNFAVYFMAVILLFSTVYAAIFIYRTLRENMELRRLDASLLTLFLFSFAHVMVPAICPDHFVISLMLLSMTIYIASKKMKRGILFKPWQSCVLMVFTAGMATSNGVKTILAGLFANGKRFFTPRNLFFGIALPMLIILGIQQSQYYALEVPQQKVIANIEQANLEKDSVKVTQHEQERNAWLKAHNGQPAGDGPITKLMDVSTPRMATLVENFFGESLQLHQQYLLKDVMHDRPIFVHYDWLVNYLVEIIIVLLFIAGVIWGRRERLMWMLLSWFACDVTLHLVMGFAINEVYIMTAGWAFIIPLSIGFMARGLRPRPLSWLRLLVGALTAYLWLYNGGQLVYYLLTL